MPPEAVRLLSAPDEGLPPDLELAAYLYLPAGRTAVPASGRRARLPGIVVGHGAGSRASRHEQFCLEASRQGFVVLALDFRGHGASQGKGDGPLEQDILAAVRFLRDHPAVDPRSVCYRGSSMGGFYGLKAAPGASFAAMALICPASEATMLNAIGEDDGVAQPDTEAEDETPSGSDTRWDNPLLRAYFERQDSLALASRVACPVLLIHARGDGVVPFAHSLALVQHLHGDTALLALEGGSHTTAQHDPAIHSCSVAWLKDHVVRARASGRSASGGR